MCLPVSTPALRSAASLFGKSQRFSKDLVSSSLVSTLTLRSAASLLKGMVPGHVADAMMLRRMTSQGEKEVRVLNCTVIICALRDWTNCRSIILSLLKALLVRSKGREYGCTEYQACLLQ